MIGWIRNAVLIFLVLSIIYAVLWIIGYIKQKDKLESDYEASNTEMTKTEYVTQGMDAHNKSTRWKLMLRVYAVPLVIAAILIYLANAS